MSGDQINRPKSGHFAGEIYPMSDQSTRAPAQTEHEQAAIEWIKDRENGGLPEQFARSTVIDAFSAGIGWGLPKALDALRNGVGLMTEAAVLFREYEKHHRDQSDAERSEHGHPRGDRSAKAERNAEIAERIETFLLHDTTPKDRIARLALSLVQDLDDLIENTGHPSYLEAFLGKDGWKSYTALRDALDGGFPPLAPAHPEPGETGKPTLTLVVNGAEYRTQSRSVRGKIGGCPIRAEWAGGSDLRIHLDTPGYEPPPAPSVVYSAAPSVFDGLGPIPTTASAFDEYADLNEGRRGPPHGMADQPVLRALNGRDRLRPARAVDLGGGNFRAVDPVAFGQAVTLVREALPAEVEASDPAATVKTIEAAIAGGLIPGIDADRLARARVEVRLFGHENTEADAVAMADRLSCSACGGSGHSDDENLIRAERGWVVTREKRRDAIEAASRASRRPVWDGGAVVDAVVKALGLGGEASL
jgi:hypothetical protein